MKVVILAGGFGTRLSEETSMRPKPMVEIGGRPMLWHIMKIYSAAGFNEFVVCLGYKGYMIKEYFANYHLHQSDVTIDIVKNEVKAHRTEAEPWKITLIDTGLNTMTGGRIKRIQDYVDGQPFMLTYGDGVGDVDINGLVKFHQEAGKQVTVTAVQPSGRFGALDIAGDGRVSSFIEKPKESQAWINGGFFLCEPTVFDCIEGDSTVWEREPMEKIASEGEMVAFKHEGFWQCMDTLRDKNLLESHWESGTAPWKIW